MPLKLDTYNTEVKAWAKDMNALFKTSAARFGIVHRADSPSGSSSINKFRNRFTQQDGAINKIGITFPRSLIYTHKGAGKGKGGIKGSRWVDKYGAQQKTNPKSFGKMGTGARKEKPFLSDALNSPGGVEALATIAAEELAETITGNLFINPPWQKK